MPERKDTAHPGQAKSALRKKLRRNHKALAARNRAQKAQDAVRSSIVINGTTISDAFTGKNVSLRGSVVGKYFARPEVPLLEVLRFEANMNGVSYERALLSELLTMGYELEELEVSFTNDAQRAWGRSVWYKDHPTYRMVSAEQRKLYPKATARAFALISAMFKTEHAGDRCHTLLSSQMMANEIVFGKTTILLHKSLIFHRAVLTQPREERELKAA